MVWSEKIILNKTRILLSKLLLFYLIKNIKACLASMTFGISLKDNKESFEYTTLICVILPYHIKAQLGSRQKKLIRMMADKF